MADELVVDVDVVEHRVSGVLVRTIPSLTGIVAIGFAYDLMADLEMAILFTATSPLQTSCLRCLKSKSVLKEFRHGSDSTDFSYRRYNR